MTRSVSETHSHRHGILQTSIPTVLGMRFDVSLNHIEHLPALGKGLGFKV